MQSVAANSMWKCYNLEKQAEIGKKQDVSVLDASLPAVCLYEHRGYKTVGHGIYELENDVKLVYEIMEKKLRHLVENERVGTLGGYCYGHVN